MDTLGNIGFFGRWSVRGLTLIELLVSIAVLGVVLGVAIPSLSDLLERRRVVAITQELAGIFNYARSEANASREEVYVHLEKDPNAKISCAAVVGHHGAHQLCKCYDKPADMCSPVPKLRIFQIENSGGVSFEAAATYWGPVPKTVSFARDKFFPEISGVQVTVTGKRTGTQLRVELNDANRVRICSPGGSIGGYPICS